MASCHWPRVARKHIVPAYCAGLLPALLALTLSHSAVQARSVDVRSYGAVGDGVADDTPALQRALDAVRSEGGAVYVPAGRYRISDALRVHSRTSVHGDGPASEIVSDKDGWRLDTTQRYGMLTVFDGHSVEISKLTLRGTVTASHMMTPKLIYLERVERISIHDNYFEDTAFEGLWQGGKPDETRDVVVSRNFFRNIGRPAGQYVGLPAIQMNAYNAIISDNVLRDVGTGIGASGSNTTVVGNRIEGIEVAGIGTGDGGPQSGMLVANNSVLLHSSPTVHRYGIRIEPAGGPAHPVVVSGNSVIVEGEAEHVPSRGMFIINGVTASLVGNAVTVMGKGLGIELLGHEQPTSVLLSSNSVHILNERARVFGISGSPHGPGRTLTVVSVGNRVVGATIAAGSFAFDFNANSGGALYLKKNGDTASGGSVRYESGSGRIDHLNGTEAKQ